MSQSLRDLRRKIKGVTSTRQVTKAMELLSAAKMRKAIQNATTLRRYSLTAWSILQRVASSGSEDHPALKARPVKHVLIILFTSDRGLAGNLNAQLTRTVTHYLHELQAIPTFQKASFIAIGRKGQHYLSRTGQSVIGAFPAYSDHPTFRDILPISRMALEGFSSGIYDHVAVLYANFVSPLVQQPTARVLLPLSRTDPVQMLQGSLTQREGETAQELTPTTTKYRFEPSTEEVLNTLLPQITELQIYQGLLEATASEHSARMVAMRNASDNASDLIDDLTMTYNQTRQATITAELAELSASKAALE